MGYESKRPKVWGSWVNGVWTEVKAYKKSNAVKYLQTQDKSVRTVYCTHSVNSHQAPIDY